MKRVLICGGRNFDDLSVMSAVMMGFWREHGYPAAVIHGDAAGADRCAGQWAERHGVKVEPYPADWERHGRAAGPIRNQQMLDEAKPDIVIAFPGGRGTTDMVRRAEAAGIEILRVE